MHSRIPQRAARETTVPINTTQNTAGRRTGTTALMAPVLVARERRQHS